MNNSLIFIYDRQCPFCKNFAELIELKSGLNDIKIINARENKKLIPKGYDIDQNGAILINGDSHLYGDKAINFICSKIKNPSSSLLKIISLTFASKQRARFLFPFLIFSRRFTLRLKGVPNKIAL